MESTPPSPPLEAQPAAGMPLGARLLNVFTTPGEVFDGLKAGRSHVTNWLAPMVLWICIGVAATLVVFSQEAVVYQLRQQQERVLEKKLSHLPREQRDQAMQMAERFSSPTILKVIGSVSVVFVTPVWFFGVGLALWLVGRFILKGSLEYLQAVELCGLAGMIWVLGTIIWVPLVIITGNINSNLGPMLLVHEFDPTNLAHLFLASLNVITFWYISVLALGLARLTGVSWLKAGLWLFIPYAVLKSALIGGSWLIQRLVGG
jgi:hypothetical protein